MRQLSVATQETLQRVLGKALEARQDGAIEGVRLVKPNCERYLTNEEASRGRRGLAGPRRHDARR